MRRVEITLSQHNGATSVDVRISPVNTTDMEAPGTYTFATLAAGHVIDSHKKADQEFAKNVVRIIGSELLRELSCEHGGTPFCVRVHEGYIEPDYPEVIAPA